MSADPPLVGLPDRYTDLGRLAAGGMGEVRRVRDERLRATLVMKVCLPEVAAVPALRLRFVEEARLTAQLHHPGIVGVHDVGELSDGRPFFTMEEVRGRTFEAVIREREAGAPGAWTLHRAVDALHRACQAVAYAHAAGVVHRDLKPENLMVGSFGEVRVMDWGLALPLGAADLTLDLGPREAHATHAGVIVGTPAYMAPEQAAGRRDRIGAEADVYALGAVLYTLLAGRAPYAGPSGAVIAALLAGPPPPLDRRRAPEGLCTIAERAMARDRYDRHAHAGELADALGAWLEGAQRRKEALAQAERAQAMLPGLAALRAEVEALRAAAERLLDGVGPQDPAGARLPAWELQDRAETLASELTLREVAWHQELAAALSRDPELPEAHALLADHYREALAHAEASLDPHAVARSEALLRSHDRGRHAAYLAGMGALTLHTTLPVRARLHRYVDEKRRMIPVFERDLGPTPLRAVAIPKGSWLITLHGDGPEVRYPVRIDRAAHWDGVPPGASEPEPIWIPGPVDLASGEVYVPAGSCVVGGDPAAADSLPRQTVWVGAFLLGRFPVTVAVYAGFLEALLAAGEDPEPYWPWTQSRDGILARDGARVLPAPGVDPRRPINGIPHPAAVRAAAWLGGRLPHELEVEKAARGVDGRLTPWGRTIEERWSRVLGSVPAPASLLPIGAIAEDEGPYGVADLVGNVRCWCANWWSRSETVRDGRIGWPASGTHRAARGGFYGSPPITQRAATRFGSLPSVRAEAIGLRVARDPPVT